jgi:hypothetical protein
MGGGGHVGTTKIGLDAASFGSSAHRANQSSGISFNGVVRADELLQETHSVPRFMPLIGVYLDIYSRIIEAMNV